MVRCSFCCYCCCCCCWRVRGVYHVTPHSPPPQHQHSPRAGGGWTSRLSGLLRSLHAHASPTSHHDIYTATYEPTCASFTPIQATCGSTHSIQHQQNLEETLAVSSTDVPDQIKQEQQLSGAPCCHATSHSRSSAIFTITSFDHQVPHAHHLHAVRDSCRASDLSSRGGVISAQELYRSSAPCGHTHIATFTDSPTGSRSEPHLLTQSDSYAHRHSTTLTHSESHIPTDIDTHIFVCPESQARTRSDSHLPSVLFREFHHQCKHRRHSICLGASGYGRQETHVLHLPPIISHPPTVTRSAGVSSSHDTVSATTSRNLAGSGTPTTGARYDSAGQGDEAKADISGAADNTHPHSSVIESCDKHISEIDKEDKDDSKITDKQTKIYQSLGRKLQRFLLRRSLTEDPDRSRLRLLFPLSVSSGREVSRKAASKVKTAESLDQSRLEAETDFSAQQDVSDESKTTGADVSDLHKGQERAIQEVEVSESTGGVTIGAAVDEERHKKEEHNREKKIEIPVNLKRKEVRDQGICEDEIRLSSDILHPASVSSAVDVGSGGSQNVAAVSVGSGAPTHTASKSVCDIREKTDTGASTGDLDSVEEGVDTRLSIEITSNICDNKDVELPLAGEFKKRTDSSSVEGFDSFQSAVVADSQLLPSSAITSSISINQELKTPEKESYSTGRRDSIASTCSVVSEGSGARGVTRVLGSTLVQWRRLQGSVGSLTSALKQRYHHRRLLRRQLSSGDELQVSSLGPLPSKTPEEEQPHDLSTSPEVPSIATEAPPSIDTESSVRSQVASSSKQILPLPGKGVPSSENVPLSVSCEVTDEPLDCSKIDPSAVNGKSHLDLRDVISVIDDHTESLSLELSSAPLIHSTKEDKLISVRESSKLTEVDSEREVELFLGSKEGGNGGEEKAGLARVALSVSCASLAASSLSASSSGTTSSEGAEISLSTVVSVIARRPIQLARKASTTGSVKSREDLSPEDEKDEGPFSEDFVDESRVDSAAMKPSKQTSSSHGDETITSTMDEEEGSGAPQITTIKERAETPQHSISGRKLVRRPSQRESNESYEGEPLAKRASIDGEALPWQSPATTHSSLSLTRRMFCEAMIGGSGEDSTLMYHKEEVDVSSDGKSAESDVGDSGSHDDDGGDNGITVCSSDQIVSTSVFSRPDTQQLQTETAMVLEDAAKSHSDDDGTVTQSAVSSVVLSDRSHIVEAVSDNVVTNTLEVCELTALTDSSYRKEATVHDAISEGLIEKDEKELLETNERKGSEMGKQVNLMAGKTNDQEIIESDDRLGKPVDDANTLESKTKLEMEDGEEMSKTIDAHISERTRDTIEVSEKQPVSGERGDIESEQPSVTTIQPKAFNDKDKLMFEIKDEYSEVSVITTTKDLGDVSARGNKSDVDVSGDSKIEDLEEGKTSEVEPSDALSLKGKYSSSDSDDFNGGVVLPVFTSSVQGEVKSVFPEKEKPVTEEPFCDERIADGHLISAEQDTMGVSGGEGPVILITAATGGVGVSSGTTPTIVVGSGSAASGWGGAGSLEGAANVHTETYAPTTNSLAAHLAAHPRPPTPKSPITVDEWVAALPHPTSVDDESETWAGSDPGAEEGGEDLLLGAEAGLMVGALRTSRVSVVTSAIGQVTATVTSAGATHQASPIGPSEPGALMTLTEGATASFPPSPFRQSQYPSTTTSTTGTTTSSTRPLTLSDVESSLQQQQLQELQQLQAGVEGRRMQFAGLREKQASFQSELSGLSFQSKSSIDSLLESRQADPVDVLLNLGFGGQPQDPLARIPDRFLKPSQVPGNNIEEFMRSEEEFSDMMESAEWMPGLDAQALRRSSVATVSPLMSQLLDNIRESRSRSSRFQQNLDAGTSGANHTLSVPAPTPPAPPKGASRFASVAKSLAVKSSIMNTLNEAAAARPNKLSVLNPENRRLLDLQEEKSPEVPRKRLIIGQSSFDLGRDGELLSNLNNSGGWGLHKLNEEEQLDSSDENDDDDDDISEDEGEEMTIRCYRPHARLQHKESVWSMASSATSIDSSEEDLREQRLRLQLSLSRRPTPPDTPGTPSTPGESLESPQLGSSPIDTAERRRKLLKRLGSTKRVSCGSCDDLIPEEDDEEDYPLQDQVISEAEAPSIHNLSEHSISHHSEHSQLQHHSSCLCLSDQASEISEHVFKQNTSKQPSDIPFSAEGMVQSPVAFTQQTPGSVVHHPDIIRTFQTDMRERSESQHRCSTDRVHVQPVIHHSTYSLQRQHGIDESSGDVGFPSHKLQPPRLQQPQCRHHLSPTDQSRGGGGGEGSTEETGRGSAATGPLCRSGSAQSDSSGFMEGDIGEGDTRGSAAPAQLSRTNSHVSGHAWWWSRESAGSMETVRHVPLSQSMTLQRHNHSHHTRSLEQAPSIQDPSLGHPHAARGCSLEQKPAYQDYSIPTRAQSFTHVSPPVTQSVPSATSFTHLNRGEHIPSSRSQRFSPLYSSQSLDSPSAFRVCNLRKTNACVTRTNPAAERNFVSSHCCMPTPCLCTTCMSRTTNSDSLAFSNNNQSSDLVRHITPQVSGIRRRRNSLPEPLTSINSPEMSCPHCHKSTHMHNCTVMSHPYHLTHNQQVPELPPGCRLPVSSELVFPPIHRNSRQTRTQHSVESTSESIGPEGSTTNSQSSLPHVHQLPLSEVLLDALQSYRRQLSEQEHLSRQLHSTTPPISPVTSSQFNAQLRNISAIRAAIKAELIHMEQMMASAKTNSFSQGFVNQVIAQMVLLLHQQSELCHDLETLTLASSQPSSDFPTPHDNPLASLGSSSSQPNPFPPEPVEHNSIESEPLMHNGDDISSFRRKSSPPVPERQNTESLDMSEIASDTPDTYISKSNIHKTTEENTVTSKSPTNSNVSSSTREQEFHRETPELQHVGGITCNTLNSPCDTSAFTVTQNLDDNSGNSFTIDDQQISRKSALSPQQDEESLSQSITSSGSCSVNNNASSVLSNQMTELVRAQVVSHTQQLQQQLIQQTKDMADIKDMMNVLMRKLT